MYNERGCNTIAFSFGWFYLGFVRYEAKMRLFVYYNLHRKRWSLRDVKTRRVIDHCDFLTLLDARFKVSEAGRRRVLKESRKNVHAGVEGNLAGKDTGLCKGGLVEFERVRYNPYEMETFQTLDGMVVHQAEAVCMSIGKVFALNPW